MNNITHLDKLTSHEYNQLGRILTITHPEFVKELERIYTPTLTDQRLIPDIHNRVLSTYPGLEQFDRDVLITACVYSLYCPAALINCGNAPAGMRRVLSNLMGYQNATNLNYWQDKARAFVKSARYVKKVQSITSHYHVEKC